MTNIQLIRQTSRTLAIVFLYVAIFLAFSFAYKNYLTKIFEYMGFEYGFDVLRMIISLVTVFLFAAILSFATKKTSHIFLHIHFFLLIIPMVVFYNFSNGNEKYFFMAMLSFALVIFLALVPIKTPKIKQLSFDGLCSINSIMWALLILGLLYVSFVILFGGLRYINLNIWNVYEFRRDAANNLPPLFNYLTPITSKVIAPILLALSLYKKNWFFGLFAFALSIFIFATAAHKGPLFMSIAIIGIYILLTSKYRLYLLLSAQIVVALGAIYSPFLGDKQQIFGTLIMRRVYFVPAMLNYEYYNFFSVNEKVVWSNSKITLGMLDYPYELSVPNTIGEYSFNSPETSANTGWLGAGYSHLGFAGIFIYAFFIGLFIRFTDFLARKTSLALSGSIFIIPYISLFTSTDIPTMLLTHGLLFIILFVLLLKKNVSSYAQNRSP